MKKVTYSLLAVLLGLSCSGNIDTNVAKGGYAGGAVSIGGGASGAGGLISSGGSNLAWLENPVVSGTRLKVQSATGPHGQAFYPGEAWPVFQDTMLKVPCRPSLKSTNEYYCNPTAISTFDTFVDATCKTKGAFVTDANALVSRFDSATQKTKFYRLDPLSYGIGYRLINDVCERALPLSGEKVYAFAAEVPPSEFAQLTLNEVARSGPMGLSRFDGADGTHVVSARVTLNKTDVGLSLLENRLYPLSNFDYGTGHYSTADCSSGLLTAYSDRPFYRYTDENSGLTVFAKTGAVWQGSTYWYNRTAKQCVLSGGGKAVIEPASLKDMPSVETQTGDWNGLKSVVAVFGDKKVAMGFFSPAGERCVIRAFSDGKKRWSCAAGSYPATNLTSAVSLYADAACSITADKELTAKDGLNYRAGDRISEGSYETPVAEYEVLSIGNIYQKNGANCIARDAIPDRNKLLLKAVAMPPEAL